MDEIAVGQIGYGYSGSNLARQFSSLPGSRLALLADVAAARRRLAAAVYPGTRVVGDAEEVWASPEVDAVVLATPARDHASQALAALAAGKHVFVEKPLALTLADAEAVAGAARTSGRVCMVGHLLLYHPVVERLERLVRSGDLGDIFTIESERTNLGKLRADENAWWSIAPDDVSMILHLAGSAPVWVSSFGQSFLREGVEDVVFTGVRFASGAIAHIHVSWLCPHQRRRLTVVGSAAMAVFDDAEAAEKLRIYDRGVDREPGYDSDGESLTLRFGDILIPAVESTEPLQLECAHFLHCVRTGAEPLTGMEHSLQVCAVLEAADRSLREGGPVVLGQALTPS